MTMDEHLKTILGDLIFMVCQARAERDKFAESSKPEFEGLKKANGSG